MLLHQVNPKEAHPEAVCPEEWVEWVEWVECPEWVEWVECPEWIWINFFLSILFCLLMYSSINLS
jgi:hypothetical protein